jgi:DNA modification methylase
MLERDLLIIPRPDLRDLVTFIPNKREAIHNWYYYKEGYSRQLVEHFLKKWDIKRNEIVFDPFCGVGTTVLACKQNGISCFGTDVSPLAVLVAQVKTWNYDLEELEQQVKEALGWKFSPPKSLPKNKFFKRALSKYALQDIIFYREKLRQVENPAIRNFLLLALMDSAFRGSYLRKDGAVVKIKKQSKPPVGKLFKYKIRRMLRELKKNPLPRTPCSASVGDARFIEAKPNSIDYVITSPPYLNKIEYTQIYKFEYSLFFNQPESQIPAFIGGKPLTTEEKCEKYFSDMEKVLGELQRICKPGAKMAIVIGGGCFPDKAVLVDEQLAKIAEDIGLTVENILVARNSWCTKNRTEKVGNLRESAVILKV